MNESGFSWRARARSFRYAFDGIKSLIIGEHNARIHCVAALCVVLAGLWLGLERWDWVAVALCIGGVLMAEGFNSAVEALADKTCGTPDPLIKRAKDIAAGAVLLFVMAAVAVGLLVFVPKICSFL